MRQHSLVKHSGIVNKCPSCDFTHYFPGKVRRHYKQVHLKMRNLTRNCNQCEFIASYRDQLDTHIAHEHEGRVLRCDNCDFIGKNRHNLRNHVFSHHKEKVYNCDKCEYKCAEKSSLKKHSLGRSRIICNECDHVTFSKKDLQRHKKSHHGIRYSCSQCPFNTKKMSNLGRHRNNIHRSRQTPREKVYNQWPMRGQVRRGALLKETLFEAQKGEECGKWLCHIFREIPTKTYKKEPWVPNKRRTKTKRNTNLTSLWQEKCVWKRSQKPYW